MTRQEGTVTRPPAPGCNVNSTFNFSVGAIVIAAVIAIAYFIYRYWLK